MTRIWDDNCAYNLYEAIVQDRAIFEAVYHMCLTDIQRGEKTPFQDYVNGYCWQNGMVDANDGTTDELMMALIYKHDHNTDASPPPPCPPLFVGSRVFDDYCRYQLYKEIVDDETKLDKWRPIAVKAVEKQDFSEVREHVQAYCGQQNMVCFYDEQYCILAQNLADQVSKEVPASEPVIVGTRIFDWECLKQFCRECERDSELYNAMCQLAIRVIVNDDFSEFHAFLYDYCKQKGMMSILWGLEKAMLKLFFDEQSFRIIVQENLTRCMPQLLTASNYKAYSRYVLFNKITKDPKLRAKCLRMLQKAKPKCEKLVVPLVKDGSVLYNFLKQYCLENNIVCPISSSFSSILIFERISERRLFIYIQHWRLKESGQLPSWWSSFITMVSGYWQRLVSSRYSQLNSELFYNEV